MKTERMEAIEKPTVNVLLIGNSQMSCYNLPRMLTVMSEAAPTNHPRMNIGHFLLGGGTLKKYWDAEGPNSPRAQIMTKHWDKVVIQEIYNAADSKSSINEFEAYATKFDDMLKKAGAKMLLFATANVTEYFREKYHYPDSFKQLNDMQLAFGKEKGIPVATAGYVWMQYMGVHPSKEEILDLYHSDKAHPGKKGTYIYACLLYAMITGENPEDLTCEFSDIPGDTISSDEAIEMQKTVWSHWKEDKVKQNLN